MAATLPEANLYDESDGYEWTGSTSSDSGIASCAGTRPPSNASSFSLENDFWSACSTFEDVPYAETGSMFVQQTLSGMLNSDVNVVKTSSMRLLYLCRSGYTESILSAFPDILTIIRSVFHNIDVSKDVELMHYLSGIFYYLTETEMSWSLMSTETGIFIIKEMLSFTLESALCYATAGLHNMLSNKTLREKLRVPPIISQLIHILWTCYLFDKSIEPIAFPNIFIVFASASSLSKFLAVLFDSLYLIAHRNETAKRLIHIKQGIIPLLHFIRTHSYEKLHWTCARLLRCLSAHPQTKVDILNHDSELSFFSVFVNSSSPKITFIAYWILCNLSDKFMSVSPSNLTEILTSLTIKLYELTDLLSKSKQRNALTMESLDKFTVLRCIAGTLANFTCRNPSVKSFLVQSGLVSLLTRLLVSILQSGPPGLSSCPAYIGHPRETMPLHLDRGQINLEKYSSISDHMSSSSSELELATSLVRDLGGYRAPFSTPLVTHSPSLTSCSCGQRSLSIPHLQTATELVEAALRCLTHLSSAHSVASDVTHCLLSSPDFLHTLCGAGTSWMLEVLQLTSALRTPPQEGLEHRVSLCTLEQHVFLRSNQSAYGFELSNALQLAKVWLSLARVLLTEVTSLEYPTSNSQESEELISAPAQQADGYRSTGGRVKTDTEQITHVRVLQEGVARLGPKLRDILHTIQPGTLSRTLQATVDSCQNLLEFVEHL